MHAGIDIKEQESGNAVEFLGDDVIQDAIEEFGLESGCEEDEMDEIKADEQGMEDHGSDEDTIQLDWYAEGEGDEGESMEE